MIGAQDAGPLEAPQHTQHTQQLATDRPSPAVLSRVLLPMVLVTIAWGWLLEHVDWASVAARMRSLPAWAWGLAGLALMAGHAMRAARLQQEWRHCGDPGFMACLRLVTAHNVAVLLMPLRTGEAGYLWLVRRQWGVDLSSAAASLVRWRLQDAVILCVLAILLLPPWGLPARLLLAVAFAGITYLLAPLAWRRLGPGWLRADPSFDDPRRGALASAMTWSLKILAHGGLLAALCGVELQVAWRAALGGELAGVQPIQPPAGLGTYEAGVWLAARLPQEAMSSLVGAALAVHAFSLCIALGAAGLCQLLVAPSAMPAAPRAPSP